jgi:hypothetical protein
LPLFSKVYIPLPLDTYVPDLVHASDCVLGKVGYGFVSECLCHHTPLVYISRSYWAEEACLTDLLQAYDAGLEMPFASFVGGEWGRFLSHALRLKARGWKLEECDQHVCVCVCYRKDCGVDNREVEVGMWVRWRFEGG